MSSFNILEGDCFELIKELEDNSVDLVVTSPPYTDIINYGKEVSIKKPEEYVDWLLPLFTDIYRVLKPSGSFILNINDNCKNGLRNPYIYELIYRNNKETKLKLYDTYIWHKKNGIPNGSKKRFRNNTEFIFHFVKNQKGLKFYMDRVLVESSENYRNRLKYPESISGQGKTIRGERIETQGNFRVKENNNLVRPDNVFRFRNAGASRDNTIKHPAPFNRELPEYFINLLTDEGDVVLDPFSGIATTGLPCVETGRKYIGYELNPKYVEFSKKRLGGIKDDTQYFYGQYDMEGNLINTFDTIKEIEDHFGEPCENNIKNIIRGYKRNLTLWGYKWTYETYDKMVERL